MTKKVARCYGTAGRGFYTRRLSCWLPAYYAGNELLYFLFFSL